MMDWNYGRDVKTKDLYDQLFRDRHYEDAPEDPGDSDFDVHFTLDGDPLCCDCAADIPAHKQYTEFQAEEAVGTCTNCGGML
jgi:hypothetical protein